MKTLKMLSFILLFFIVTLISCDNSNNNNQDEQDYLIHSIQLDDGGEVNFYNTEDGLVRMATTRSEEVMLKLSDMSCIEICKEYGDGIIPNALQKAYEKDLALEMKENEKTTASIKNRFIYLNADAVFPEQFFYGSKYRDYNEFLSYSDSFSHLLSIRGEKIKKGNHTGNTTWDRRTKKIYSACYVVSGLVHHKLRRRKLGKWKTLRTNKVYAGYYSVIGADNLITSRTYRVFFNAKKVEGIRNRYHFYIRMK